MENRRINFVLGIVCIVLLMLIVYMWYLIYNNEKGKVYFDLSSVKNTKWVSGNTSFYTNGKTLTFVTEGDTVINDNEFDFNKQTGEFIIEGKSNSLYMRNISENSIIVWYKEREYTLNK